MRMPRKQRRQRELPNKNYRKDLAEMQRKLEEDQRDFESAIKEVNSVKQPDNINGNGVVLPQVNRRFSCGERIFL